MTSIPPSLQASFPESRSRTGVPNTKELFEPGYTWQHDIARHDESSASPLSLADLAFFGQKANQDWASAGLTKGRTLSENTFPGDTEQHDLNHLLHRIAILSRAATDAIRGHHDNEPLQAACIEVRSSYTQYRKHLDVPGGTDDLPNTRALVGSLICLTGELLNHVKERGLSSSLNAPPVYISMLQETGFSGSSTTPDLGEVEPESYVKAGPLGGMTSISSLEPRLPRQVEPPHALRRLGNALGSLHRRRRRSQDMDSMDS